MLSLITKIKLEQMAYGAMFATLDKEVKKRPISSQRCLAISVLLVASVDLISSCKNYFSLFYSLSSLSRLPH
jgi:hypothetical protein